MKRLRIGVARKGSCFSGRLYIGKNADGERQEEAGFPAETVFSYTSLYRRLKERVNSFWLLCRMIPPFERICLGLKVRGIFFCGIEGRRNGNLTFHLKDNKIMHNWTCV
jgi:hypothetical protein